MGRQSLLSALREASLTLLYGKIWFTLRFMVSYDLLSALWEAMFHSA